MRTILWHLLLIVLPFALYWAYVSFVVRKKTESGGKWDEAPFTILLGAGLVLAIGSMVLLGLEDGQDPSSVYEPAQVEDGELKPGGWRRVPQPDAQDK